MPRSLESVQCLSARLALAAALALSTMECAAPGNGTDRGSSGEPQTSRDSRAAHAAGRLVARPRANGTIARGGVGVHRIGGGSARGGIIVVPASYDSARPARLMLLLHGAGGSGEAIRRRLSPLADSLSMIVIAPDSRGSTWDFMRGPFGPDVELIDSMLQTTFDRYRVDSSGVIIAGFSDGASYALSLGMTNGTLFSRIVAFSPGMDGVIAALGRPRIFVSHGSRDQVLAIEQTSQRIVPRLRARGYDVSYREFDGRHEIPADVVREAVRWLEGAPTAP
ncbi:MAG: alpha/beta hydrolase-fold protein [Gemmatimonadaceae bacterium]